MEFEILPKKRNASKTYKHFIISSDPGKETASAKTEFFYIGKNSHRIDFLIKNFESGYAVENVEKAISILERIPEKHKLPEIIIIDSSLGEFSLKELKRHISGSTNYSAVPVVLDASGLTVNELQFCKSLGFFDEFIFMEDMMLNAQALISKINFLKRVKKGSQQITRESGSANFDSKYFFKRIFDIIVSFLAILILSPLFLFIALAIKFESKGPVLYVSKRAGRGYRIFDFYKFRTMEIGADEKIEQLSHLNYYNAHDENDSVFFKVINDERITRIGAFLRNSSLDELPQFFNVLLGHMSLVGNRPLPLYEASKLTTNEWAGRFMAPAGITGLWQIKKRDQEEMSMEERINLDIVYTQKYGFMYDLWIMANTPAALIQKSNT